MRQDKIATLHRHWTCTTIFVFTVVLAFVACNQSSPPKLEATPAPDQAVRNSTASSTPRIPDYHARIDKSKPLPQTLDPARFSTPYIARAYRIAKEIPEVLAQQPCYCYCDAGFGHGSLLECHIDDHSAG